MINRGIHGAEKNRIKALGTESVHGLPLDLPEPRRKVARSKRRLNDSLATQSVHGLPTEWEPKDFSA